MVYGLVLLPWLLVSIQIALEVDSKMKRLLDKSMRKWLGLPRTYSEMDCYPDLPAQAWLGKNDAVRWILEKTILRGYVIVRVKTWKPWWGPHGIEWPCVLADYQSRRMTVTPVWNCARISSLWNRL
jgi:hypothetical protein